MHTAETPSLASLFAKKRVTVLVTDSGLGGMAIFAGIAARLRREPLFPDVSMVYYNAWPEQHRGYNGLEDMDERVRVFDRALEGMKRFRPDIIMIACNTLSVLFDRTEFSRRETLPVIDIVRFGVDRLYEALAGNADAAAVILGTVTTIASDVHRSQLIERGIAENRIVVQPCDQLATAIEKGPGTPAVAKLVDTFTAQAAEKLGPGSSDLFAALCCTHFGYCGDLIREKLENRTRRRVTLLDPNRHMAGCLFEAPGASRHGHASVALEVVSRIVWDQTKIDAIAGIVEKQSPADGSGLEKLCARTGSVYVLRGGCWKNSWLVIGERIIVARPAF